MGVVEVIPYSASLRHERRPEEEWQEYLEQTENHERILREVFEKIGLDPEAETPGRMVVRHIGESLVEAMETALESAEPAAARALAAECVVEAETKDHMNWGAQVGLRGQGAEGRHGQALKDAHETVERAGGRAPVSHDRLGARAVDPVPRH